MDQVSSVRWYQTIELPTGGATPGVVDTAAAVRNSLIPGELGGKRCLDVGTSNGFWAFEMERRGAGEVVAVDLADQDDSDWPAFDPIARKRFPAPVSGFELARRALRSRVERRELTAYEISEEALGRFDLVFAGSLLLHLRDPVGALMAFREVTDGGLVLNESISLPLTLAHPRSPAARLIGRGGSNWWVPNIAGLRRVVEAAGFEVVEVGHPYMLRWGEGAERRWGRTGEGARARGLARNLGRLLGIPHVGLRARPRAASQPS